MWIFLLQLLIAFRTRRMCDSMLARMLLSTRTPIRFDRDVTSAATSFSTSSPLSLVILSGALLGVQSALPFITSGILTIKSSNVQRNAGAAISILASMSMLIQRRQRLMYLHSASAAASAAAAIPVAPMVWDGRARPALLNYANLALNAILLSARYYQSSANASGAVKTMMAWWKTVKAKREEIGTEERRAHE